MKRVFIFKPSSGWIYCGGGLVVVAENYEAAVSALVNTMKEHHSDAEDRFHREDSEGYGPYDWVLVEEIAVGGDEKSRVVLADWNYA